MFNSTLLDTVRQKSGYPILIPYYPVLSRKSRSIPIVVAKKKLGTVHPKKSPRHQNSLDGIILAASWCNEWNEWIFIYMYIYGNYMCFIYSILCNGYIYICYVYIYIHLIMWQLYVVVLEWRCAYAGRKTLSQPIEPFGSQMGMCCDWKTSLHLTR